VVEDDNKEDAVEEEVVEDDKEIVEDV